MMYMHIVYRYTYTKNIGRPFAQVATVEAEAGELRAETLELRRQLRDQAAREEEYRAEFGESRQRTQALTAQMYVYSNSESERIFSNF